MVDETNILRVGIMGAARIARKNILAIQSLASNCKVVAIASRSVEKAETLRKDHVLEERHIHVDILAGEDAYDQLIQSEDVDAIYIPLPVCVKKDWVIKALGAKKHVLVEKPVASQCSDYDEMLSLAKKNSVWLMDGTMFVHHTRTEHFLNYIAQKDTFGQVTRINSEFTFRGDDDFFANDIRTSKGGDPFGCLGDLGWYCIRLAQIVFQRVGSGAVKEARVTNWKMNKDNVPIDATCLVTFHDENTKNEDDHEHILSFHCSFLHPLRQRVEVCGTKQSVSMFDYVIPKEGSNSFYCQGQDLVEFDRFTTISNDVIESPDGPVQEVLMWRNFSKYCRTIEANGWTDGDALNLSSMSKTNQAVCDALMESIKSGGKAIKVD